jgi:hypothetical protein
MIPKLSNNTGLPPLNGMAARSTWLVVLATLFAIASAVGIDLGGILAEMGIGATPEEVVASGERAVAAWQVVAPHLLGTWAWIERRAPKYRLVWPWSAPAEPDRMIP